jgi:hypothetical protein
MGRNGLPPVEGGGAVPLVVHVEVERAKGVRRTGEVQIAGEVSQMERDAGGEPDLSKDKARSFICVDQHAAAQRACVCGASTYHCP